MEMAFSGMLSIEVNCDTSNTGWEKFKKLGGRMMRGVVPTCTLRNVCIKEPVMRCPFFELSLGVPGNFKCWMVPRVTRDLRAANIYFFISSI